MKSRSSSSRYRDDRQRTEIVETEISDWYSIHHLPRHLSTFETKSHRGRHNLCQVNYVPKACQTDTAEATKINLINILKYQLGDNALKQKHIENVRLNLEHRLQMAKATGNNQLVDLLQDEYKQLKASI